MLQISASDAVTKHILHPCVVKIQNEYRPGNSFNFKPVIDTSVALFLCKINPDRAMHYNDVIMTTMASQIRSLAVVYSIVYSDADQKKYQSSESLAFVRGIHRWPVNSPHKGPVTRKMFPFDDVIMGIWPHFRQNSLICPSKDLFSNHWFEQHSNLSEYISLLQCFK